MGCRSKKRKEIIEVFILRKGSIVLVLCVYNLLQRTIFRWLARYRNSGWHTLTENNRKGLPSKVSGEDMKCIYDIVTMGNPVNYKLPFSLFIGIESRCAVLTHVKANVAKRTIQNKDGRNKIIMLSMQMSQNKVDLVKSFSQLLDT